MSWSDKDYVKLLIWRPPSGPDRWLIALRTTADYYGWTQQFEPWSPKVAYSQGGYDFVASQSKRGRMYCESGIQLRISRHPSRQGHTPGMVNAFKVSASCTMFDLSEIAHLTQVDWYWMSSPRGGRLSREEWRRLFEAGTQAREGGLVLA